MIWRKDTIREVSMVFEMAKNVVSMPRISATLPGDMSVQGIGTSDGTFNLSGAKLRDTLTWLGIDAAAIPKDRLQGLSSATGRDDPGPCFPQAVGARRELRGTREHVCNQCAIGHCETGTWHVGIGQYGFGRAGGKWRRHAERAVGPHDLMLCVGDDEFHAAVAQLYGRCDRRAANACVVAGRNRCSVVVGHGLTHCQATSGTGRM